MTLETGVIVYDALFLTLAEAIGAVMVTADRRLLSNLESTPYARLARSLAEVESLI
jgi:predicted nucleic acid-binding protein